MSDNALLSAISQTPSTTSSDPPNPPDVCSNLPENSTLNLIFSLTVIIGMILTTIPSIVKIYQKRSSLGLSPYYLLLSICCAIGAFCNISLLQYKYIYCCPYQDSGICFSNLLGILTVLTQLLLFSLFFGLYIYFYPSSHKQDVHQNTKFSIEWLHSIYAAALSACYFLLTVGVSVILLTWSSFESSLVQNWARALGYINILFALFQHVPQIIKTLIMQSPGSVSIPALALQTPGAFILVYSLYDRAESSVTTWIGYFISACLQTVLFVECLFFFWREKKKKPATTLQEVAAVFPAGSRNMQPLEQGNCISPSSFSSENPSSNISPDQDHPPAGSSSCATSKSSHDQLIEK